jgi:hypothetical protein
MLNEQPVVSSAPPEMTALPCPLCRRGLATGDSAGLHGGRVLHLDCYIAVLRTSGDLLSYLKRRIDEPFCTTCLVSAIAVTFDETALAHSWLRAHPGIRLEVAPCASCGARRVTIAYEMADGGAAVPD